MKTSLPKASQRLALCVAYCLRKLSTEASFTLCGRPSGLIATVATNGVLPGEPQFCLLPERAPPSQASSISTRHSGVVVSRLAVTAIIFCFIARAVGCFMPSGCRNSTDENAVLHTGTRNVTRSGEGKAMKLLKWASVAALLATCAVASVNVQAQDECALINRIIDSGMDRQNPFAAVAGLKLPNANSCDVEFGEQSSESNYFVCQWNAEMHAKIEQMRDEQRELRNTWRDHEGGGDYWDEAEELIEKANYWIRTYNAGIEAFPQPNSRQLAKLREWEKKAKNYVRMSRAAEQEAIASEREKEEAKARFDATRAEYKRFRKEVKELAEKQSGALYTGVNDCFSSGAIRDASAYQVDAENKSWQSEGGCEIYITRTEGPRLFVYCPNPHYRAE